MNSKARALLKASKLKAAFLSSGEGDANLSYFTGLPKFIYANHLLIKSDQAILYSSNLDFGAVKANLKDKTVKVKEVKDRPQFLSLLSKDLKGVKKVGLNFDSVSVNGLKRLKKLFKGKRLVDISPQLADLRAVKTKAELKTLKHAVSLSERALAELLPQIKAGRTEREIQSRLDAAIAGQGLKLSFESIVASGPNSAVPHHISSKRKLRKGDLLLIDFGVSFDNYCADLSRTYALGKASALQRERYGLVYSALQAALKEIRPGNQAKKAFQAAQKELYYGGFDMVHALGHGIGLRDHDFPSGMGRKAAWLFKEDMVLAVEPAIYVKNWGGIRLEDNVVVKKGKPLMLSRVPKELIEL